MFKAFCVQGFMLDTLYTIALISPRTLWSRKIYLFTDKESQGKSWDLNQGLTPQYHAASCKDDTCVMSEDSKEGMTPLF